MAGIYLNSYPLTYEGAVRLYKLPAAAGERRRRQIEDDLGIRVWVEDSDAFSFAEPQTAATVQEVLHELRPVGPLSNFAVREALIEHCRELGLDAWSGRAGEVHVSGAIPPATADQFHIEHVLRVRIASEEYVNTDAVLTARHRTAWRTTASLASPAVAAVAVGQPAHRVRGEGPRRGQVSRIDGPSAVLRWRGTEVAVNADDYSVAANAAFISRWRGSQALRQVRVAAGDMTVNGRRNQHGVRDRFKLAGDAVRAFGGELSLVGGGRVTIGRKPVEVRLETNA